ncbi:MAG: RimK-like ATPgrasp N-terminal domain-containing protein [Methanoregula sp.]|nr:RimK-like ATPgrasp N-terminal domain-containing protein [Methanoregula sp.]
MNDRWGDTPQPDDALQAQSTLDLSAATPFSRPKASRRTEGKTGAHAKTSHAHPASPENPQHLSHRREPLMTRDSLVMVERDDELHIISEDYSYKTEAYYTILEHEQEGKNIRPSSRAVLDAFVVPICLERAKLAGIPVVEWGISQAYVPLPAILYGLNYFATASDFFVVQDNEQAKDVIKHITNKGKYPFCYQKLGDGATIHTCTAVFGQTTGNCMAIAGYASMLYDLFSIPLVSMVFVKTGKEFALSSLAPTRYTHLSDKERAMLAAYRDHQEFL